MILRQAQDDIKQAQDARGKTHPCTPLFRGDIEDIYKRLKDPEIGCCSDCACRDCVKLLDCDIRESCSECRPMTLIWCSEYNPSRPPLILRGGAKT